MKEPVKNNSRTQEKQTKWKTDSPDNICMNQMPSILFSAMEILNWLFVRTNLATFKDQTGHNYTENRTEPHLTEISVFSIFGLGFSFRICTIQWSVSASVWVCNRTVKPRNRAPSQHARPTAAACGQAPKHSTSGPTQEAKTAHHTPRVQGWASKAYEAPEACTHHTTT
jgi:hypothetical protein